MENHCLLVTSVGLSVSGVRAGRKAIRASESRGRVGDGPVQAVDVGFEFFVSAVADGDHQCGKGLDGVEVRWSVSGDVESASSVTGRITL